MAIFKVLPKKKGKNSPEPVEVDGRFVRLGRNMNLEVVLEDMLCAYEHARIDHIGNAFVIEDVGSHSGTFLAGHEVSEREQLEKGTQVILGATMLTVTECDPEAGIITLTREELAPPKAKPASKSKEEEGEGASLIEARGIERWFSFPRLWLYGTILAGVFLMGAMGTRGQAAFMNGPLSKKHAEATHPLENRPIGCTDCHTRMFGVDPKTCASCHEETIGAGDPHGQPRPHAYPATHELLITQGLCESCHTEHVGDRISIAPDRLETSKCMECHPVFHQKNRGGGERGGGATQATQQRLVKFNVFPHETHTEQNGISCTECHKPAKPGSDGDIDHAPVGYEKCITCHYHKEQAVADHGSRETCTTCHVGEENFNLATATDSRTRIDSISFERQSHQDLFGGNCTTCHVDATALDLVSKIKNRPFLHGAHLSALQPSDDSTLTTSAALEAQCVGCHEGVSSAADVAASAAVPPVNTCKSCHQDATETRITTKEVTSQVVAKFSHADHLPASTDRAAQQRLGETDAGNKLLTQRCFACHEVEQVESATGLVDHVTSLETVANCTECHTKSHQLGEVSKCATCHIDQDLLFNPGEPAMVERSPSFFSHRSAKHSELDCNKCHENVKQARTISDITTPSMGSPACEECHAGGKVEWDCYSCHKFHDDPMLEGTGGDTIEEGGGQ